MSFIDYLKMLFGWLPNWFIITFFALFAILAVLLVFKIIAFIKDLISVF